MCFYIFHHFKCNIHHFNPIILSQVSAGVEVSEQLRGAQEQMKGLALGLENSERKRAEVTFLLNK